MPAYNPSAQVFGLVDFRPSYSAGSKDTTRGPGRMYVTGMSGAGGSVTLNVAQIEGNIPAVGDSVTVTGTAQPGANITALLTAVSITPATGVGTITYLATLTPPTLGQSASGGQVIVAVPEVGETLAVQKYRAFAISSYGVSWGYTCPSAPVSIAIQLEAAINNVDAEFNLVGTSQTAVTGYPEFFATVPILARFVRVNVTATTGGVSPTLIAKLLASRRSP